MPLVNDSGIGWPCILASFGLGVERLQVRRAAGHVEVDDPLGLGREVERMDHAASSGRAACGMPAVGSAAASRLGSSSEASASVPSPVVERRRNARRWMAS